MSADKCFINLKASLMDRGMTASAADALSKEITDTATKIAADRGSTIAEVMQEAGALVGMRAQTDKARARERKFKNLRKRLKLFNYIKGKFPDNMHDGLRAVLTGTNQGVEGARASVANVQETLFREYFGGMLADLNKGVSLAILKDTTNDGEVLRALWSITKGQDTSKLNPEIVEAARILDKYQKKAKLDLLDEGVKIAADDPYWILRTAHKSDLLLTGGRSSKKFFKMNDADARQRWIDFVTPLLDWRKITLPEGKSRLEFLDDQFSNLSRGLHLKYDGIETGRLGAGDIAKRQEEPGVFQWADGASFLKYNKEYGAGSLREAAFLGMEVTTKNVGLMRVLGSRPDETFNQLRATLTAAAQKKRQHDVVDKLRAKGLDHRFAEITGASNIPGNKTSARIWALMRAVQSISKLGGAMLSSFPDLLFYAAETRAQGRGLLTGYGEAITGLMQGRRNFEKRQLASVLGAASDAIRGQLAYRFSAGDVLPGWATRKLQTYFKLNLLEWWTDSLRQAAVIGMSANLGFNAGVKFTSLDARMQTTLGLFNIDEGKWDMLRNAVSTEADGRAHIVPENVSKIPDADIVAYLGGKADEATIRKFKRTLETEIRGYYVDRSDFMVLSPQADTQAVIKAGTQPGTVDGELRRMVWQFKAFPLQIMRGPLGREFFGGQSKGSTVVGLTHMAVMGTVLGYMSLAMKDISKGREPRDPEKLSTWTESFVQGGASGLFGDFLLGGTARYGGNPITNQLGPSLGTLGDLGKLAMRARDGESWAPGAVRLASQNTPGANLFYTRWLWDHFFLYNIQESLSPGYLRRKRKRVKEDFNSEYFADSLNHEF